MAPIIVNLDSAFDWTVDVGQIWEQLEFERIRQALVPQISPEEWVDRSKRLAVIGLVSSQLIDNAYRLPAWEEANDRSENHDEPLLQDWRKRQLGPRPSDDEGKNNFPGRGRCFNGEEPFFHSPRVGHMGIVECYGIYTQDASTFLGQRGLLDKLPADTHHAPAILLCPERIHGIYPTIMTLGEEFRQALPLSSNPALVNLRMTLIHELGHHFFPVQRCGGKRFLSEALANLFCKKALTPKEQAWLLYKTWHLQPPEYSAYRPLSVLCDADSDCRAAVARCFHSSLDGWASLPAKDGENLMRRIGASLSMALAADAEPCIGLWRHELWTLGSKENRWFLPCGDGILHFHLHRNRGGHLPADLLLDLYRQNDLAKWAMQPAVPQEFWMRWGNGAVAWPNDHICIPPTDVDPWLEYYANSPDDTPLASVICEKLVAAVKVTLPDLRSPAVRSALHHALAVAKNLKCNWFDRVPAMQLIEACRDVSAVVDLETISGHSSGDVGAAAAKAAQSLRANIEVARTYCAVNNDESMIDILCHGGPKAGWMKLHDFINKQRSEEREGTDDGAS